MYLPNAFTKIFYKKRGKNHENARNLFQKWLLEMIFFFLIVNIFSFLKENYSLRAEANFLFISIFCSGKQMLNFKNFRKIAEIGLGSLFWNS